MMVNGLLKFRRWLEEQPEHMGPVEDALSRSGPDHISSLLEGGWPGPPGVCLSGLAFQSVGRTVTGP